MYSAEYQGLNEKSSEIREIRISDESRKSGNEQIREKASSRHSRPGVYRAPRGQSSKVFIASSSKVAITGIHRAGRYPFLSCGVCISDNQRKTNPDRRDVAVWPRSFSCNMHPYPI